MLKTFSSLQILTFVGFVGGTHYSTQGGGVNYQCLPLDPDYNLFTNASNRYAVAVISGAEYETGYGGGGAMCEVLRTWTDLYDSSKTQLPK